MRWRSDETEKLVSAARPASRVRLTATEPGEAMLARILDLPREPQRRRRNRKTLAVAGAVVAGVVLAGGATAAIGRYDAPTAPPEALPTNGDAFVCATEGLRRMGDTRALEGETPVAACRRSWKSIFDRQAPAHLYPCVQRVGATAADAPGAPTEPVRWGRLVYVVDGDQLQDHAGTCGSVGMLVAPAGD
ncbi:hypothetical protein E0H26_26005 [Micromonospora zingiberis]|uniref:Uncharacterized protein n=1 Tax=Micromonospora zingiberis TaxID=2053011 RepID=A0A4R0G3S1_9ACTN|nr:hypothetical protein [Micromonospora zingiberis]TCB91300.1 hypothetical protein E0H26_26005 [Micromonospora zingiberis]